MKKILIVDDEQNHRLMIRLHLEDKGYSCYEAENGRQAYDMIKNINPDIILLDITMEIMDGFTLLSEIRNEGIETPVIIITARTDIKTAVSAMKLGAADFITKPVNIDEMILSINDLLFSDKKEKTLPNEYKFNGVYVSQTMNNLINLLSLAAPTDAAILILGESGTGKELIAKSIHDNSPRAKKPFIAVNCAALNDNLIESELFGHVKGAFTGASSNRQGRFEQANGGTIFLDELGEIPLTTQSKLLRVLQEKIIEPVGSEKYIKIDVRVIAATNRNINKMIEIGKFREDLYFRLSVFPVTIPPLRDRTTDIPPLIEFFIKKYSYSFGKNIKKASDGYISKLKLYHFPGNIRELENIVMRSIILSKDEMLTEYTLPAIQISKDKLNLKETEKQSIVDALERTKGNKTNAAKILGISRRSLYYKIEEYGITEQTSKY